MSLMMRAAVSEDVVTLMHDLRRADLEEWSVGLGKHQDVATHLHHLIDRPLHRVVSVMDEKSRCLAMWGHNRVEHHYGANAWMLCTNAAVNRVHAMHRFFEAGIAGMHADLQKIVVYAYYRNSVHIEWMQRMGFKYAGDAIVLHRKRGVTEGIFLKFTREAKG